MTNLFEIKEEYLALLDQVRENDGIVTEELEKKLVITIENMREKCHAYRSYIVTLQGENNVIDDEIKRLQAIKKRNNNTIEYLNNKVLSVVIEHGAFMHENVTFTKRRSQYVKVEDVDSLPEEFKKTKVEANKKAITEHLKNGAEIHGCSLEDRESLVMR